VLKDFYAHTGNGEFEKIDEDTANSKVKSANSFKNYKCARHDYFYEVNLYTTQGKSRHHQSEISGNRYSRDGGNININRGIDKGNHW